MIEPRTDVNSSQSSSGLKHCSEESVHGFYIPNGALKARWLTWRHVPADPSELNWLFCIKKVG
jgi:hypothetical protein